MTEKVKESISALLDEEISEIELHRLLRHYSEDPSLRETLVSYQQIRAIAQGEHSLTSIQHLELHSRICDAIDAEPDNSGINPNSVHISRQWLRPVAGVAVAASMMLAVFVGLNNTQEAEPEVGNLAEAAPGNSLDVQNEAAKQTVAGTALPNQTGDSGLELRELDDEKQRRLRQYLNQHDLSRLDPNIRTVIYDQPGKVDPKRTPKN